MTTSALRTIVAVHDQRRPILPLFEPPNFLMVEARREWETRQPPSADETAAPATGTRGTSRREGLSLVAGAAVLAAMTQGEQLTASMDRLAQQAAG